MIGLQIRLSFQVWWLRKVSLQTGSGTSSTKSESFVQRVIETWHVLSQRSHGLPVEQERQKKMTMITMLRPFLYLRQLPLLPPPVAHLSPDLDVRVLIAPLILLPKRGESVAPVGKKATTEGHVLISPCDIFSFNTCPSLVLASTIAFIYSLCITVCISCITLYLYSWCITHFVLLLCITLLSSITCITLFVSLCIAYSWITYSQSITLVSFTQSVCSTLFVSLTLCDVRPVRVSSYDRIPPRGETETEISG